MDLVGDELNAERPFWRAIKGRGRREKRESRAERTKCCRTDFGASLSLLLSLSSAPSRTCAGFEEARAVRGTPRVRPAAPPTCFFFFPSVRRNIQGSASVRRPVRFR